MPKLGSTIAKLLILSLIVGMVMALFGITPKGLIENFGETIADIFNFIVRIAEWGARYVLLGAVIVVPIWLIKRLLDAVGRKNRE